MKSKKIKKHRSGLKYPTFVGKKKTLALLVIAIVAIAGGYKVFISQAAVYYTDRAFLDISSPQCGTESKIGGGRHYGIVGLNGTYMAFGNNKCAVAQTKLFNRYDLYVGVNYPSSHCASSMTPYDCGLKAAAHNVFLIKVGKLNPGIIWIDVETGPRIPWKGTKSEHSAFIFGMAMGLKNAGYGTVGYYSTEGMWNTITGGLRSSGPNWYATGQSNATDAKKYCSKSFGGAKTTYVQYIDRNRNLDVNVKC